MQCPLCREDSASWPAPSSPTYDVSCSNCGHFRITDAACDSLKGNDDLAFDLASWVYGQHRLGSRPKIERKTLEWIKTYPKPDTKRRVELYLGQAIRLLNNKLIGRFVPNDASLRVASWSRSGDDAVSIANYLTALGAFEETSTGERRLVAKAHIMFDEMSDSRSGSSQVFVAMWFDASMTSAYNAGFSPAISESGYKPLRIDRKEHDRKIDDEIVAEIRRSAFVVADFTEHRGGVYYEAGFAHGLGKNVIFTCNRSHLDKLHFDVRQYNTIPWDVPTDLVAPLQNRILAVFGAGPLKPDAKPVPI